MGLALAFLHWVKLASGVVMTDTLGGARILLGPLAARFFEKAHSGMGITFEKRVAARRAVPIRVWVCHFAWHLFPSSKKDGPIEAPWDNPEVAFSDLFPSSKKDGSVVGGGGRPRVVGRGGLSVPNGSEWPMGKAGKPQRGSVAAAKKFLKERRRGEVELAAVRSRCVYFRKPEKLWGSSWASVLGSQGKGGPAARGGGAARAKG